MRKQIALLAAGLLLAGCSAAPKTQSDATPSPSVAFDVEPVALDGSGHKMPWPKRAWVVGESSDRMKYVESQARPPGVVDPPAGQGYGRYYVQRLDWAQCGEFECAKMLAPLDWENPDGLAVTIALKRSAIDDPHGVLFVNPGGPGGSALDYVDQFGEELRYDIVGMDPRGSGKSTPVVCSTGEELDRYLDVDVSPDDSGEVAALIDAERRFATDCRKNSGALLDHVSTIDTVYDFDLARRLLGQEKFNFLGVSYGTLLGATYAELFPDSTGKVVLDSAVSLGPSEEVSQAVGFERNLSEFARWCASKTSCELGSDEQSVTKSIKGFLDSLDSNSLSSPDGRMLTQSRAVAGLLLFFYTGESFYDAAGEAISKAIAGDPTMIFQASDAMTGREPGGYSSLIAAASGIGCLDQPDSGLKGAFAQWSKQKAQAPVLGHLIGPDTLCPIWTSAPRPRIAFSGDTETPVLVLANTEDSATPYEQSVLANRIFKDSILVTRKAPGHGVFGSSRCADRIVADYFNESKIPETNLECAS
ncbi:alpha/beta fold hydrolase [Propionimicrobium lymphophilum]|uniref:alpha/beta fold hydrolase n=1 Tax=Propionimicrobium lymphophilum TaxID=33012 RepID=UPI00041F9FF2|nr:alpha/beta fold hydrolase [Propionimicrobium lymphophilum]